MKGLRFFLLLLAMGGFVSLTALSASAQAAEPDNPVAQVRDQQSWEVAPFVNYGNGFGNRDQYKFFWAGAEFGKILTPVIHAGFATGQFQFAGNIMPLVAGVHAGSAHSVVHVPGSERKVSALRFCPRAEEPFTA